MDDAYKSSVVLFCFLVVNVHTCRGGGCMQKGRDGTQQYDIWKGETVRKGE